jgi:aminoglycoside phosphotransferase (APT) family kinase protein
MEAEAAAEGLTAPFLRLRASAPGLGLRALVAPLDPTHPRLVRLSSPRRVPELLSEAGVGHPAADWSVTAIRYRPGQRHVLRWTPSTGTPLFAKLYRHGEGAGAFRVANLVGDLLAGEDGLAAARPLAYLAADDVVIYPLVPGRPLGADLRPTPAVAAHLAQAGVFLRALHGAPAAAAAELPPRSFADDVKEVDKAAGHVRFMLPEVGALLDDFIGRALELDRRLGHEAPVFTHGDYKADHLWGSGRALTVIDFNTCSLADPALDLGKLMADLRWSGRLDPAWARRHLLAGYGPASAERLLRTRLHEALVLAKITIRRVRVADPDWAARTTTLLTGAARLLDEL